MTVLRYLKSSPRNGIVLPSANNFQLTTYSDSDWASYPNTRCSTTGYFTTLGSSPFSWKTKNQSTVSCSSAKAEYRSMDSCEVMWLKYLLHDLHIQHPQPMRLFCDSHAALQIAANPVFHERTKHIELD